MREVLFRGKRMDNGEWVYGGILQTENWTSIFTYKDYQGGINEPPSCDVEDYEVIPSTIGEFTGLTDKNGNRIFEGDIVEHTQRYDISGVVTSTGVIKWSDSYGGWIVSNFSNGRADMFLANEKYRVKIIGNIHDNPELLKGGVEE